MTAPGRLAGAIAPGPPEANVAIRPPAPQARWDDMVQQGGAQGACPCPSRASARGPSPMRGRHLSLHLRSNGAEQVGDGASPGGQPGREPPDQRFLIRGRGPRGPNDAAYQHGTGGAVQGCRPALNLAGASFAAAFTGISPSKGTIPHPAIAVSWQKRQKSS
jgi:hypothetical protein